MKNTEVIPKAANPRITRNSKLFKTIIDAIQEKKGENIVSLDLKKINEASTDFFIICEASNHVQLGAILDNIEKRVKEECAERPFHTEGTRGQHWLLLDYVNVVVHCFSPEQRVFYNLEEMWSDADFKEHNN